MVINYINLGYPCINYYKNKNKIEYLKFIINNIIYYKEFIIRNLYCIEFYKSKIILIYVIRGLIW